VHHRGQVLEDGVHVDDVRLKEGKKTVKVSSLAKHYNHHIFIVFAIISVIYICSQNTFELC
jgi:hypothetical protein